MSVNKFFKPQTNMYLLHYRFVKSATQEKKKNGILFFDLLFFKNIIESLWPQNQ